MLQPLSGPVIRHPVRGHASDQAISAKNTSDALFRRRERVAVLHGIVYKVDKGGGSMLKMRPIRVPGVNLHTHVHIYRYILRDVAKQRRKVRADTDKSRIVKYNEIEGSIYSFPT